jgi:hypothetical protein
MTAQPGRLRLGLTFAIGILIAALTLGWLVASRIGDGSLVDGPVTGAMLIWHPGVNSGGADVRSSASEADAGSLADLINKTRRPPSGPVNCPADFGSEVQVTFRREGDRDQPVAIELTGCAGPTGRMMSEPLQGNLRRLAPPGFWPERLQ